MTRRARVVTAKSHLSDLVRRLTQGGQRCLIERRGKAVAALVSAEDWRHLEEAKNSQPETHGMLDAIGAWDGLISEADWDEILADIYKARETSFDRSVEFMD